MKEFDLNDLTCKLYSKLSEGSNNIFLSPYSISSALALAASGARGETLKEMRKVLRYKLPIVNALVKFAELNNSLGKNQAECKVANAAYVERTLNILDEYKGSLSVLGDVFKIVDFLNNSEGVRREINEWVEEQTNSKIKDLVPEGAVNQLTRLVLVNAIYFKGLWASQFSSRDTIDTQFLPLDSDSTVTVQSMRK